VGTIRARRWGSCEKPAAASDSEEENGQENLTAETRYETAMRTSVELGGCGFQIADAVFDRGAATTKVNGGVPIAGAGHNNSRRKLFEASPEGTIGSVILVALKVCVAHDSHIALVRALNDNRVACV
jgi:hypothetical protein